MVCQSIDYLLNYLFSFDLILMSHVTCQKHKGGAEKLRNQKKAVEVGASKCLKITNFFLVLLQLLPSNAEMAAMILI